VAIKSLVTHVEIDTAGKAHNCQASAKHRIEKGDERLKVRNGRSWDHYCLGKVRTSIPRTKNENFSHLISMGYQ